MVSPDLCWIDMVCYPAQVCRGCGLPNEIFFHSLFYVTCCRVAFTSDFLESLCRRTGRRCDGRGLLFSASLSAFRTWTYEW